MATDVASLAIRVESQEVTQASSRLKDLAVSGQSADKASGGLAATFTKLIGPLTALVSAAGVLGKVLSVQREFDVLNAGLITATGSIEKAAVAFDALQEFAAKTPYSLQEAVDGFNKLVNLGLTPSEAALTSYGNTASAMGKSLNQMVEAVADAATGQFERLKEFGIVSASEGNKVTFTFQGIATTVGKSAAEIEKYLMALGETEFAGAMAARMSSLDGAMANLGDSWDSLFREVSQSGVGAAMEASVRLATTGIEELSDMLASGQIQGYLRAITGSFDGWGRDIDASMTVTTAFIAGSFKQWGTDGEATLKVLSDSFVNFGANIRAAIGIASVEVATAVKGAGVAFKAIGGYAGALTEPWDSGAFSKVTNAASRDNAALLESRKKGLDFVLQEWQVTTKASADELASARQLRAEYDAARAAKAGDKTDRTSQFKKGGGGEAAAGKAKKDAAATKRENDFKALQESLMTEEEAISASYAKRQKIIADNTKPGSSLRSDLTARLDKEHTEALKKFQDQQNAERESLQESLRTQEEAIEASYAKRMEVIKKNFEEGSALRASMEGRTEDAKAKALSGIERQRQQERDGLYNSLLSEEEALLRAYDRKKELILESEAVTELERQDLLRRLKQTFDEEQAAMEAKRIEVQLMGASSLFGGLAGIAKSAAGEQSQAYKVLFAISKAFAVTQAAMSISTGMAKALELGFPQGLAVMAQVAAQGAGLMSTITGSQFSGAHDQGGQIPAGKIGIVGEYGPELVRGPASIRGRELTSRTYPEDKSQAIMPAPQVNVRNINVLDPAVVGDYLGTDAGEKVIMNILQQNKQAMGF